MRDLVSSLILAAFLDGRKQGMGHMNIGTDVAWEGGVKNHTRHTRVKLQATVCVGAWRLVSSDEFTM